MPGIRIRADASQAEREGQKAERAFRGVGDSAQKAESKYSRLTRALGQDRHWQTLQRGLGRTTNMLMSFQSAVIGAAGIGGMGYLIDRNIQAADQIGKTAAKVGVGVEALQELRYAAELAGVSQKNLDMGLQRFSRRVAEAAQGQGELLKVVEKYGVSLQDSQGRLRSTNELLGEFANVVRNAETEQERLRIAFKMFDSEGAAMVNLLREGSDAINDLRKDARDLGIVLDREMVKNAEEANDQLTKLKKVIGAQLTQVVVDLAPEIGEVAGNMGNWVSQNKDFLTQDVPGHIRSITGEIAGFVETLNKIPEPILYGGIGALFGGRVGGKYGAIAGTAAGLGLSLYREGIRDVSEEAQHLMGVIQELEEKPWLNRADAQRLAEAREEFSSIRDQLIMNSEEARRVSLRMADMGDSSEQAAIQAGAAMSNMADNTRDAGDAAEEATAHWLTDMDLLEKKIDKWNKIKLRGKCDDLRTIIDPKDRKAGSGHNEFRGEHRQQIPCSSPYRRRSVRYWPRGDSRSHHVQLVAVTEAA